MSYVKDQLRMKEKGFTENEIAGYVFPGVDTKAVDAALAKKEA